MDVKEAIEKRRAFRSLAPVKITKDLIMDLAQYAQLSPSCFNNQPWQYVFVFSKEKLGEMFDALSSGNDWAKDASLIIAVHCREEDDCIIHDRKYFHFDTGLATAFLILRATELGLVAHPIAGYSPKKTRKTLHIPDDHSVIALVIVGKHASVVKSVLSEKQAEQEIHRPQRHPISHFVSFNEYSK